MRRPRSNTRKQTYSETREFGRELENLLAASRYSSRGLGEKIGRDGSTVAGWCRGRTLPEDFRDVERIAELLNGDAELLSRLIDFDEAVYAVRNTPMSGEQQDTTVGQLKTDLEEFVSAQKRSRSSSR